MKAYTDIVDRVLRKGSLKRPVRIENGKEIVITETLALPNVVFTHEMSDGFPLLTTKKVAVKAALVELEGFIKGVTSKSWYQERNCKIWNEWANPVSAKQVFDESEPDGSVPYNEHNRKQAQLLCDDLGPVYGYQGRKFGENYPYSPEWLSNPNGVAEGTDQLKSIVDKLHQNPYDRRMVCSYWNPNQLHLMALPPCHFAWGVSVMDGTLNLYWVQRSADLMLGVPFDIVHYAGLLLLLAKEAKLVPGNLTGLLADCHIYTDHLNAARLQLSREPRPLPTVKILDRDGKFSIFDWQYTDVVVNNYEPHPAIKMEVTV